MSSIASNNKNKQNYSEKKKQLHIIVGHFYLTVFSEM